MAYSHFKKGTSAEYLANSSEYEDYIYACEDTRDVYVWGVLQQGITDEQYDRILQVSEYEVLTEEEILSILV